MTSRASEDRVHHWCSAILGVSGEPTPADLKALLEILVESPHYQVWIGYGKTSWAHFLPDGSKILQRDLTDDVNRLRELLGKPTGPEVPWSGELLTETPGIDEQSRAEVCRLWRICFGPDDNPPDGERDLETLFNVLEETPWRWGPREVPDGTTESVQLHRIHPTVWIPRDELETVVATAAEMDGLWKWKPAFLGPELEIGDHHKWRPTW